MSVDDEPVGAGNEETFQSVRELLIALGRDAQADVDPAGELEGFVVDHVDHDLGNSLFVDLSIDGQIVMWTSTGVNMWALEFPFTRQEFYDFLDELDLRSTRMLALQGLPGRDDEDDEDWESVQIPESLAAYLQVADSAFVEALGARWRLLDCEVDGYYSTPVRVLLWREDLVVGLDDEFVHLYARSGPDDDIQAGGEPIDAFPVGGMGPTALDDFADRLRHAQATVEASLKQRS